MVRKIIALILITVFILSYIPPDLLAKAAGPPEISRVLLRSVRDTGDRVTLTYEIRGKNFVNPLSVYIDDIYVMPNHVTDSTITIIREEDTDDIFAVGLKTIRVVNGDGESEEVKFEVVAPPHITAVSKTKAKVGEPLEIYGTGFEDITSVVVAGVPYTVGPDSDNEAVVNPEGNKIVIEKVKSPVFYSVTDVRVRKDAGLGSDVPVEDAIEGILRGCISVVGKLTDIEVVSLEPDSGHVSGGTVIRMMGNVEEGKTSFNSSMRVFVGGNEATDVQVITDSAGKVVGLQAVTPPGVAGECEVVIQDSEGHNEYVLPQKFTYVQAGNMLVVTDVTPSYAKESQQQKVVISGRNIATLNISQLQDVELQQGHEDEGYDPLSNQYTLVYKGRYNDSPVTIERKIKVTIGLIAPIEEVLKIQENGDQISVTTPIITLQQKGIPEIHDVVLDTETVVTDANGSQVIYRVEKYTLRSSFTYLPDMTIPEIDSITPGRGPWDQDIYISIKGTNFQVLAEEVDGVQVKKYPVIKVGPRTIDPNDDSNSPQVRVYDSDGNLLDGKKYTIGTEIRTVIPAGDVALEGFVNVSVTNPDGGYNFAENLFRFMDPQLPDSEKPRIDRLDPDKGTTGGGTEVKIFGANFDNRIENLIVTIDGAEALVKSVNSLGSQITIITPPGEEGFKTVQVINGDGSMATLVNGYYYTRVSSDPVIFSIAPDIGGAGTWVIIRGRDFRPPVPESEIIANKLGTRVLLDGRDINDYLTDEHGNILLDADGNIMFADDGQRTWVLDEYTIKIKIPPGHYTGPKDVTVLNPDTASFTVEDGFNYRNPVIFPVITGIDPTEGTVDGGTVVTIYGTNFWEGIRVFFGGYEATHVTVSGNGDMLQATTPAYQITGEGVKSEKVDVTVVDANGGSDTLENGFTYLIPDSIPTITRVEPGWGSTAGEDTVTIFGSDFRVEYDQEGEVSRLPEVYFGGVKAVSVRWDNHNRLTVKTPAYPYEGKVDVTVINPDAGVYTAKNAFEYRRSTPQITSVIPARGSKLGNQELTIKGSGFVKGDLSAHYQGEQADRDTDPKDPVIDLLVVFGDDKDSVFISGGRAEVTVGDIRVLYDSTQPGNKTPRCFTYPPPGRRCPSQAIT